ncbi:hypothetical protein HK102_001106 [Quaeritorhiza haematococci]|nr:hypothetical protein HK102_001106 [Quaeritorhiza haematococci]
MKNVTTPSAHTPTGGMSLQEQLSIAVKTRPLRKVTPVVQAGGSATSPGVGDGGSESRGDKVVSPTGLAEVLKSARLKRVGQGQDNPNQEDTAALKLEKQGPSAAPRPVGKLGIGGGVPRRENSIRTVSSGSSRAGRDESEKIVPDSASYEGKEENETTLLGGQELGGNDRKNGEEVVERKVSPLKSNSTDALTGNATTLERNNPSNSRADEGGVGTEGDETHVATTGKAASSASVVSSTQAGGDVGSVHSFGSLILDESVLSSNIFAEALADFESAGEGQLNLRQGMMLRVFVWDYGNGWAFGEVADGSSNGIFPQTYVRLMDGGQQ